MSVLYLKDSLLPSQLWFPPEGDPLVFRQESFVGCRTEVMALAPYHWNEMAVSKHRWPLDMDWERYAQLEKHRAVNFTTARRAGVLVGYAIYLVSTALHYRHRLSAEGDAYYLRPDCRFNGWGYVELFKASEESLKERGVKMIQERAKLHKDAGAVLRRRGFVPVEKIYVKEFS